MVQTMITLLCSKIIDFVFVSSCFCNGPGCSRKLSVPDFIDIFEKTNFHCLAFIKRALVLS